MFEGTLSDLQKTKTEPFTPAGIRCFDLDSSNSGLQLKKRCCMPLFPGPSFHLFRPKYARKYASGSFYHLAHTDTKLTPDRASLQARASGHKQVVRRINSPLPQAAPPIRMALPMPYRCDINVSIG